MMANGTSCTHNNQAHGTICGIDYNDKPRIICGMQTWHNRAKQRMKSLKITQESLATVLGCTRSNVGHYLSGRREPSIGDFNLIAKKLGMTMDELINGGGGAVSESDPILGGGGSVQAHEPSSATYDAISALVDDLPEDRKRVVMNLLTMTEGMTQSQLNDLMRRCEDLQSQNYEIVTELARSNPEFLDEILKKRRA